MATGASEGSRADHEAAVDRITGSTASAGEAADRYRPTTIRAARMGGRGSGDAMRNMVAPRLVAGLLVQRHPSRHDKEPQCSSATVRSEEHTSELQSLMRLSYAV